MRFPFCRLFKTISAQSLTKVGSSRSRPMSSTQGHEDNTSQDTSIMKYGDHGALDIFNSAIRAVLPQSLVEKTLTRSDNVLVIRNQQYALASNVHVVAFGKAVLGMVRAVEDMLGDHIISGIASVPVGIQDTLLSAGKHEMLPRPESKINVIEGAKNNQPDVQSLLAARQIHDLVTSLEEQQLLIVLMSGGGSSLLSLPIPPITLQDMISVTGLVSMCGASIEDLNTVRKNIEVLKGGGLAMAAHPAKVVSLILSDVIGDPLDTIASGPTMRDQSTPAQCLNLFTRLGISDKVPEKILDMLEKRMKFDKMTAIVQHTNKQESPLNVPMLADMTSCVQNLIVGNNSIAIEAAVCQAEAQGYVTFILSSEQSGEARHVGQILAKLACFICWSYISKETHEGSNVDLVKAELELISLGVGKKSLNEAISICQKAFYARKSACLIVGGETTVTLTGGGSHKTGKGGRNQELALSAAIFLDEARESLDKRFTIELLSAGTDGIDGPTDAAGAIIDLDTVSKGNNLNLSARRFLQSHDSYTYFEKVDDKAHIITGHTGTNVMDLQLLIISPKNDDS